MITHQIAAGVRNAQKLLSTIPPDARSTALRKVAALLHTRKQSILSANKMDLEQAEAAGLEDPIIQRLALSSQKLDTLITGLETLADGKDPVGDILHRSKLDNGLILSKVSSPIGVLLVIFESRPDAVIQIGGLAIRSGNGLILKGGREAVHSNAALLACLQDGLREVGLSGDAIQGVKDRASVAELLTMNELIDLVIPRGSGELVQHIQNSTRIPVLGHAEGVCTLYIDKSADPQMAANLAVDGKCSYPSACNATETLLVHSAFLPHLQGVGEALHEAGVTLRADERAVPYLPTSVPASEKDGRTEYGNLTLAVRTVDSLDIAIQYIHRWGSGHTESIVTQDTTAAERFLGHVDSASVFHNASTRFADGYRYGLGAEVGISTGRIHARGPVGVQGLMTTRWLLRGNGNIVSEYGAGKRTFMHETLPLHDET